MMVGIAVGLFVVAGASFVVAGQLGDNRRLLLETQLQQDLRATSDIITRELRRAGAQSDALAPTAVTAPGLTAVESQHGDITGTADFSEVGFQYVRGTPSGPWGFKLDVRGDPAAVQHGVIQTRLANGGWQDLTDETAVDVTEFMVEPATPVEIQLPCARGCDPADPDDVSCWPRLTLRVYDITIAARARSDQNVQRSVRSQVRLRNDLVEFDNLTGQVCP